MDKKENPAWAEPLGEGGSRGCTYATRKLYFLNGRTKSANVGLGSLLCAHSNSQQFPS